MADAKKIKGFEGHCMKARSNNIFICPEKTSGTAGSIPFGQVNKNVGTPGQSTTSKERGSGTRGKMIKGKRSKVVEFLNKRMSGHACCKSKKKRKKIKEEEDDDL